MEILPGIKINKTLKILVLIFLTLITNIQTIKITLPNVRIRSLTVLWKKTTLPTQWLMLEEVLLLLLNKILLTIFRLLFLKTLLRLLRQIPITCLEVLTRLCMLQRTKNHPLNASSNKDIMDTNNSSSALIDMPTISILKCNFQTAAAPNASLEFIKKYSTNKAMINAVNNLLLKTYHSYTGRAHISDSSDQKRLVIHFNSSKECNTCLATQFNDLANLRFFMHDLQQLRTNKDLCAIQVTDIPFFITKDDITALFKKYGNIQSCRFHTHANAKVQQARIVFDDASSISHFLDKQ
ncbi:hypothetical protein C1646_677247 [Rhizophagus diaphanus]|nr:hypothetical protein C1646_677247 [Rhizophagus diaphanus] [Rhizophagus sp. MUCL 43196]